MADRFPATDEASPGRRFADRRWMIVAALLCIVWVAALLWLTASSANPVTINVEQIARADVVATVDVEDVERGRCRVVAVHSGELGEDQLVVVNLAESEARAGARYVLPLSRTGRGRLAVTPSRVDGRPLVYPAGDETERQLADALEDLKTGFGGWPIRGAPRD